MATGRLDKEALGLSARKHETPANCRHGVLFYCRRIPFLSLLLDGLKRHRQDTQPVLPLPIVLDTSS